MKDFFTDDTLNELTSRINKLTSETTPQWGTMSVGQMLAHCVEPLRSAMGKEKHPRVFVGRLFGKIAKRSFMKRESFKRNLPTAKEFKITSHREFEQEKKNLINIVEQFSKGGPTIVSQHPHPFFGKMTHHEWNVLMYKHLDHHLKQFGV